MRQEPAKLACARSPGAGEHFLERKENAPDKKWFPCSGIRVRHGGGPVVSSILRAGGDRIMASTRRYSAGALSGRPRKGLWGMKM